MTDALAVPNGALVLVGDGRKALFLRSSGEGRRIKLNVEHVDRQENPSTHEQGTDQPGRAMASGGAPRSAVEQTDWHELAKERFADEIAEALYRRAHAADFSQLIVIAPPKVLSELRKAFRKEVADRIIAEFPNELTSSPIADIEAFLATASAK